MENWTSVIDYEGIYLVSDLGRVQRIKQATGAKVGRILKIWVRDGGYGMVCLHKRGKQKKHYVHRLVFLAFNKGADAETINHKNGEKLDNRLLNLESMTKSENSIHSRKVLGHTNKGVKHGRAKLSETQVHEIRSLYRTTTNKEIARKYGVSPTTVHGIGNRLLWPHLPTCAIYPWP